MSLYVVTGPPAGGKTTWVQQHAKHGDITIDYDALASVLTPPGPDDHHYPHHVRSIAFAARKAAIDNAYRLIATVDVYIIHTTPTDTQMRHYQRLHAHIITIDPGIDTVLQRCKQQRPHGMLQVARDWYAERAYIPI